MLELLTSLIQLLGQHLNFLTITCTYTLNLSLYSLLKSLLVLLFLPHSEILLPSLEYSTQLILLVLLDPVLNHLSCVPLPLVVLLELEEAAELDSA